MPEQILKAVQEAIPPLNDTKWEMYDLIGTKLVDTGVKWHFTKPNDVHDEPECWHGHWEPRENNIINIIRKNSTAPYEEYHYTGVFVANVLVVSGEDETSDRRTLIAIRQN